MSKIRIESPDENGIAIITGLILFFGSLGWNRIDPNTPIWFLFLLGCTGSWLVSCPIFYRHCIVKSLIKQGADPDDVRRQWKINIGLTKI